MRVCWLITLTACGRIGFDASGEAGSSGAIAFVAQSSATATNASRVSVPHEISGADPILFVVVATRNSMSPPPSVQAVTYNGAPLHQIIADLPAGGLNDLELWNLEAPPAGAGSVAVTLTGAARGVSVSAASYTGVQQSAAIDATASNTGAGTALSIALTTIAPSTWVVAACLEQGEATQMFLARSGQTERWGNVVDSQSWESQCGADQAGVTSPSVVRFDWTTAGGPWVMLAASFKASCAGC